MKIKSLQGGGLLTFTPFIESPTTRTSGTSGNYSTKEGSKSDSGPKNSTGILDDEIYKELVNKGGLMNDVDYLVQKLHSLQSAVVNPFMDSSNSSSALKMISEINRLRQSNEIWKEAKRSARSQDSLGEIAVGHSGEVFIKNNDNKIQAISVSEYKKRRDSVRLLTNAELLHERNQNPFLVGNDNISSVVGSSVGLNKITDHIKGIISAFGTTSFSDEKTYTKAQADEIRKQLGQSVGQTPSKEQMESLQVLNSIIDSPGDYAKVKLEKSTERGQAMKAARYIWSTLGSAAQNKLRVTAIANGVDNPVELILDMISNQTDESTGTTVTPVDEKTAKGGSSSGGGEGDEFKDKPQTPFELFHNGRTGKDPFIWNDPVTKKKFNMVATATGVLMKKDGTPIPMTTLKGVLDTEVGIVLDVNNIHFGDKKVNLNDLTNILYDGRTAAKVFMPANDDGSPNYDRLAQIKQIEEQIANDPSLTPEQINQIFAKNGLTFIQVDKDKKYFENDKFKPFLVFGGLTGDKANALEGNGRVTLMMSGEEDEMVRSMEETWNQNKVSKFPTSKWFMKSYYKGLVAIPYKRDAPYYTSAVSGNVLGPQVTLQHMREQELLSKGTEVNPSFSWFKN